MFATGKGEMNGLTANGHTMVDCGNIHMLAKDQTDHLSDNSFDIESPTFRVSDTAMFVSSGNENDFGRIL